METRIIRIKDIAEKAQVSTGTVDRVLHGRGKVSDKAQEKVLKVLKELNYEPNLLARALGTNRLFKIAALVPDDAIDSYWQDPIDGINKAEQAMRQFGITVQLHKFDPFNESSFIEQAQSATASNPDGILLAPIFYKESIDFFKQWNDSEIPFVLFNTQIKEHQSLSYIGQDSFRSGMLAAKLVHYGNAAPCSILIAHIGEEVSNAAHLLNKEEGFRTYLKEKKLLNKYSILTAQLSVSNKNSFNKTLTQVLDANENLTCIFVTTSKSYEVASFLEKKAIQNIKIIGFDLIEKNIHYLNKGLIDFLINQNSKDQGYWGIIHLANHLALKQAIPKIKFLPLDIVTAENLKDYIDEKEDILLTGY